MRIAVLHNLPSGGARRAAYELVRHTAHRYHYDYYRVTAEQAADRLAAAQDIGQLAKTTYDYSRRSSPKGGLGRVREISQMIHLQRAIAREIDERDYDLVFVHHDRLTHAPAALLSLNTPSLYYVQEPRRASFEYNLRHRNRYAVGLLGRTRRVGATTFDLLLQKMDSRGSRAATKLATNSYHSAEFIWRAYGRHAAVSYLGVDDHLFALGRSDRHGLLSVGALDPIKGHGVVIEAVGDLPANGRQPLTIAFDRERPGERHRLMALAAHRGVELCLYSGVDDAALVRLYQSSSVTVCAGAVEPFGLTTVESLSCGTPVVALMEGGYREVVQHGQNGFLADRRPGHLAAVLKEALAAPDRWDPDALRASVLPTFSWEAAAQRIGALLEEAANSPSGGAAPTRCGG